MKIALVLSGISALAVTPAFADSMCSAHNEMGVTCSVSCKTGEQAYCVSPPNNNPPTCKCISATSGAIRVGPLSKPSSVKVKLDHLSRLHGDQTP